MQARYNDDIIWEAGLGKGITSGYGTAEIRGFVNVHYKRKNKKPEPIYKEPPPIEPPPIEPEVVESPLMIEEPVQEDRPTLPEGDAQVCFQQLQVQTHFLHSNKVLFG